MKSFTLTAFEQQWMVKVEEHTKLANNGGVFDPDTRTIYISPNIRHDMQVSILLHEIIHLIEYYWSFELGNHKQLPDQELVELIENGIVKIFRENELTI